MKKKYNLTGTWIANDGGCYYLHHIKNKNELWWLGMSSNDGLQYTNIYTGEINDRDEIWGRWIDVPRGDTLNKGTLKLKVIEESKKGDRIKRITQTGGFGATVWERCEKKIDPEDLVKYYNLCRLMKNAQKERERKKKQVLLVPK